MRLLVHFPATGTPFWTEGLIVVLAVVGGAAGWTTRGVPGADSRALRFLGFYTLLLLVLYSAIPYKTPWCLLGFLHGMILLAGAGAVFLVQAARGVAAKALVCALLVGAASHLGWQAFSGSFRLASDPRNPYVYAHTGTDVFEVVGRLKALAEAHPDGLAMPIQVVSRENLWPLPWYLRGFSNVAWWNGVSDTAPSAPVIVATPDMEEALARKLYDLPPPGERELYVRSSSGRSSCARGSSCAATRPGRSSRRRPRRARAPRNDGGARGRPVLRPRRPPPGRGVHRFSHEAMATVFEVLCVHADARYAAQAAQAAFELVDRLEQLLSRFLENSDVARVNHLAAGQGTPVGPWTMECLEIAWHLHGLTGGAFDPSVGSGLHRLELDPEEFTVHAREGGPPRPRRDRQGLCGRSRGRAPRGVGAPPRPRARGV